MAVRHMVSGTGFIATVLVNVCSALACDLPVGEGAMVASVEDGETLVLTDGRKVRLAGIKAPSPPLGWKGEEPWPFVAEAKKALSALATDQEVELKFDERQTDRYGHILAQVYVVREDLAPMWLEERLVRDGFARVYSFSDARACAGELLAVEGEGGSSGVGYGARGPIVCRTRVMRRASVGSPIAISWSRARFTQWARAGSSSISTSPTIGAMTSPSPFAAKTLRRSRRLVSTLRSSPEERSACAAGSNGRTGRSSWPPTRSSLKC